MNCRGSDIAVMPHKGAQLTVCHREQKELGMPIMKRLTNQCSVCFCTYKDDESGSDWVECASGRWFHDGCIEECTVGSNGKERMCPICLAVKLANGCSTCMTSCSVILSSIWHATVTEKNISVCVHKSDELPGVCQA